MLVTASRVSSSRIWSPISSNGGRRRRAAVLDLDDVVAELGLDRGFAQVAFLELEGGIGEFLHHIALLEPAEITAFGAGRLVGRFLLGQLVEGGALLDLVDQRLGLILGRDQDMARPALPLPAASS